MNPSQREEKKRTRPDAKRILRDEMKSNRLRQKALARLGPFADFWGHPDEPVNARSRARVDLTQ